MYFDVHGLDQGDDFRFSIWVAALFHCDASRMAAKGRSLATILIAPACLRTPSLADTPTPLSNSRFLRNSAAEPLRPQLPFIIGGSAEHFRVSHESSHEDVGLAREGRACGRLLRSVALTVSPNWDHYFASDR